MSTSPSRSPRRSKRQDSSPEQAVVEGVVKGLGQLLKFIFGRGGKGGGQNNEQLQKIRALWPAVEGHLAQESTYALAVSEADKLLDSALQATGVAGESMGERLKAAQPNFPASMYQDIWDAHKLRNHLAHEMGATVGRAEAQQAVRTFRSALQHLTVL